MLDRVHRKFFVREDPFSGFLEPNALAINEARLNHLASLHLPVEGKSVLEVGAGIGLLTKFFEARGCSVLSTDARKENLAEIKRRNPQRRLARLDLERPADVARFGHFDIVFCYGTLYHVAAPEPALEALGRISDMILLETCLSAGDGEFVATVDEFHTPTQAYSGLGSRPSRAWVLSRLNRFWGHGYIATTQPSHPDFPLDWTRPPAMPNLRAIFVGSRTPLANPLLSTEIPSLHSAA
jgi:SAM-dependent methyltransferase